MTEIFHLSGMKSFRDDLIDRMKTGWGRFVRASISLYSVTSLYGASIVLYLYAGGGGGRVGKSLRMAFWDILLGAY